MLGSIVNYTKGFTKVLLHHPAALLGAMRSRVGMELDQATIRQAITQATDRLAHAQDQGADDGIGSYHLVKGWGASYPETTGYLIPTLLEAGSFLQHKDLHQRAIKAADWLLRIQRKDGGWQGGRVGEDRPSIVFNTGQVIRGMLAIHTHTGDGRYLDAALRAGDWIVSVQEGDGAWRKHNFLGVARVYDTYVDAPLLLLHDRSGDARYREAAIRNLEWVLTRQASNGWFSDADNTVRHNDRPITHTLAYTIDGLLESGGLLNDRRYMDAAKRPADALLSVFRDEGMLQGRYDRQWRGSQHPLTTGCAQLAIVWAKLHSLTGAAHYAEAAQRITAWCVGAQQQAGVGVPEALGMLPGSVPFWGRYENFAYPNWATKYLVDALLSVDPIRSSR